MPCCVRIANCGQSAAYKLIRIIIVCRCMYVKYLYCKGKISAECWLVYWNSRASAYYLIQSCKLCHILRKLVFRYTQSPHAQTSLQMCTEQVMYSLPRLKFYSMTKQDFKMQTVHHLTNLNWLTVWSIYAGWSGQIYNLTILWWLARA